MGEERLYRERADVVTITSVHSAKGLEWPVVFWCDLVRELRPDSAALLCGRTSFRLRMRPDDDEKDATDAPYTALKAELELERAAESYRLWYVASTRPQKLLVLSGVPLGEVTTEPPSVAGHIRQRFTSELLGSVVPDRIAYRHSSDVGYQIVVRTAPSELPETGHASRRPAVVETTLPSEPIVATTGRTRLSATQLTTFDRDPSHWWQQYVVGFNPSVGANPEYARREDSGSSARSGSVVHAVLERYNYELADIAELIESAIAEHDSETPDASAEDGQVYRARIRELVERAASNPAWKAVAAETTARHELTFTRILPGGGTIEGSLDLAAVTAHGVRILDAKTGGSHDHSELAERYTVQGATYMEAISSITGRPATFALLLAGSGEIVEVPAHPAISASTIAARLRAYQP